MTNYVNGSVVTTSTIQRYIPQFGGKIWYVSGTGNDSNAGTSPSDPFLTIGKAITEATAGDAINIKAGTYTELGIDVNKDFLELWFEIGALIDPASGTALTVSANSCRITGDHKITPAGGAVGVLISGDECIIENGKIIGGATCLQITGTGTTINNYAAGFPTTTAYSIQGAQTRLSDCKTVGNASTYGFKINGGADTGVLYNCTSTGHATSGYHIDTGSQDWTILHCSSGAGDGRWADTDDSNVWSDFHYADHVYKEITFAGAPTTYNVFKVTGGVRIRGLMGHVETQIANTASNLHVEAFSSNGTSDITDAPGVDIDSAAAGSVLIRNGPSTIALDLGDPTGGPAVVENTNFRRPDTAVDVVKDGAADTYIRLVISAALASGVIHWHCRWEPLTDDGFLEPA